MAAELITPATALAEQAVESKAEPEDLRQVLNQLQKLLAANTQSSAQVAPSAPAAALPDPDIPAQDKPGGATDGQGTDLPSFLDRFVGRLTAAWLAPVATGLVTCAVTLFLVSATRPTPPAPGTQLAVFDVDLAMSRLIARPDIAALSPDDPKFAEVVTGFHTALVAEFNRYAQEHGVVVISATAVLAGSPRDSTAELVDVALAAVPTVTPTVPTAPVPPLTAPLPPASPLGP